jgi:hypothetical protein
VADIPMRFFSEQDRDFRKPEKVRQSFDFPSIFELMGIRFDDLVKSRNSIESVIPAKAGIQLFQYVLDPGFRRGDASRDFLLDHQI